MKTKAKTENQNRNQDQSWVQSTQLTNTSQLYFDVSAVGQPARLYRLVPLP